MKKYFDFSNKGSEREWGKKYRFIIAGEKSTDNKMSYIENVVDKINSERSKDSKNVNNSIPRKTYNNRLSVRVWTHQMYDIMLVTSKKDLKSQSEDDSFLNEVDGCLLFFDLSKPDETFKNVKLFVDKLILIKMKNIVLCGMKSDLDIKNRRIERKKVLDFVSKMKLVGYVEVSVQKKDHLFVPIGMLLDKVRFVHRNPYINWRADPILAKGRARVSF